MPTSLPDAFPLQVADPVRPISLPAGTWFILAWAAVMLVVGFLATFSADTGPLDQFQLLAIF